MNTTARAVIIRESLLYFGGGAVCLLLAVQYAIPFLQRAFAVAPVVSWWLASGVIVAGLFFAAVLAARRSASAQSCREILAALNLRPLNKTDILWAAGGLLGVVALTAVVISVCSTFFGLDLLSQESYNSFLRMKKLAPHQYWLFAVWLPYFFFNIAGEELMWRGYLLPRQRQALGRSAWLLNGALWAAFHVGIGWRIAIILLPIEFLVPYIVQKRQNTWIGIIIHGLYNGSGFVAVALGAVK